MKGLNLGSGNRIVEGFVNHDIVKHRPEINYIWDLNITPWPWADNEFDQIQFISTIEHLKISPLEALNECWRILRADGELLLKYPLYSSPTFHDDPTHRWALSERSLDYVIPGTRYGDEYSFYTPCKWKLLSGGVVKERNYKARMTPIKP